MPRGGRIPRHVLEAQERNRQAQIARVQAARDRLRGGEFLDRVATMIMATIYTSEHIDVSLLIPATTPGGKAVKPPHRLQERHRRIAEASAAYAARRVTRDPSVLYAVSSTPAQQLDASSEVGFDTVAVTLMDGILWVARNFKVRSMPNPSTGRLQPVAQSTFNRLSQRTRENVLTGLRTELATTHTRITQVNFMEIRPAPANEDEARRPHAEMQLLAYFRGRTRGMRIGVSKGVCPRCQVELRSAGAHFTSFRVHSRPPRNWTPPTAIRVGIEARHHF